MKNLLKTFDWGLVAIVALAVAVRLPYLTGRSLWYDEASSWQTAKFSLPDLMHSVRLNVHMPLYYILLKGWIGLWGESVPSLRGFSITFGVLTVIGMFLFGRELYRSSAAGGLTEGTESDPGCRRFALFVAGLVALSPYQIFASIEARMYSLGTALTAFSSWLLLRILREGGGTRLWGTYGVTCAALLYTHHYALFTIAAQFTFLAFYTAWLFCRGESTRAFRLLVPSFAVVLLVAAAYLPGLDILRTQTRRVQQDYWILELTWDTFLGTFMEFFIPSHDYDFLPGGWWVFEVVLVSCSVVAARGQRGDFLLLASAILPLLLAAVFSTFKPIWIGRYFRFAHLFILTAVATAVWKVSGGLPALRRSLVALLVLALLVANLIFWNHLDIPGGPGVHRAVETILAERESDEVIVALDYFQYFPAKYYFGTRARIRLLQPPSDTLWGWHLIRDRDLITPQQFEKEQHHGVWLIEGPYSSANMPRLPEDYINNIYKYNYYHRLHNPVFVRHYARKGSNRSAP